MRPASDVEFWNRLVALELSMIDVLTVHGQLCLALRHPENEGSAAERARLVVETLAAILVQSGAMSTEELVAALALEKAARARRLQ